MKRLVSALMAVMWLSGSANLLASGHSSAHASRRSASRGNGSKTKNGSSEKKSHVKRHRGRACKTCERDANGCIKRSERSRAAFMRRTGYPHGRHGYVVDHVIPLECGGLDDPSNMQWQTVAEAKAKDKTEHTCRH